MSHFRPNPQDTAEPTLLSQSRPGAKGYRLPPLEADLPPLEGLLPQGFRRRKAPHLPELSEPEVVRHLTRLSQRNMSIDTHFYPLGSCTMKHNPRVNEWASRRKGFLESHPYHPIEAVQGNLALMKALETDLAELSGMSAVTLQPAAGAHGELTGLLLVRAYCSDRGNARRKVLVPDSAHGTNPATCTMAGYEVVPLKTGPNGYLEAKTVRAAMSEEVACLMMTNPNTLGIFEQEMVEIAKIVHQQGGLVYCDGANTNAIMGKVRMGDLGIDVLHFNLHKTFTTPHGGGGPGSGPVAVAAHLEPYLPAPVILKRGTRYELDCHRPKSIGRMRAFYGNFGMMVRALTYILDMGGEGLKQASEMAVLNANYIRARLEKAYHLPYSGRSLHEVVFSDKRQQASGIKTLDIAKRAIDYGFHPPTVYFPLIVPGALMIEPTETESKATLDRFCDALLAIAEEAKTAPDALHAAPYTTPVRRVDETQAARNPVLSETWET